MIGARDNLDRIFYPSGADQKSISLAIFDRIMRKVENMPAKSGLWVKSEKDEILWALSAGLGIRYMKLNRNVEGLISRDKNRKAKYHEATPQEITSDDCYRIKFKIGRQLSKIITQGKIGEGEFINATDNGLEDQDLNGDEDLDYDHAETASEDLMPVSLVDEPEAEVDNEEGDND